MNPLFPIRSVPDALRALGIALVILGALFKIQHWPWSVEMHVAAWPLILVAMVWRPLSGQPLVHREAARDLFTFGTVSGIVMRTLHLPGKGFALTVAVIGGVAWLWFDRSRFWPSAGERSAQPWLFYLAMATVLLGTLFRIQHWPYGTALLLGGLALCVIWFVSSMRSEKGPDGLR